MGFTVDAFTMISYITSQFVLKEVKYCRTVCSRIQMQATTVAPVSLQQIL